MFRHPAKSSLVYLLLLTAAGLAGCSKDLSRSKAADLIKQHQEFSAVMEVKVPVGNIWWDWRNVNDMNPAYPLKTLQGSRHLDNSGKPDRRRVTGTRNSSRRLTPQGKGLVEVVGSDQRTDAQCRYFYGASVLDHVWSR